MPSPRAPRRSRRPAARLRRAGRPTALRLTQFGPIGAAVHHDERQRKLVASDGLKVCEGHTEAAVASEQNRGAFWSRYRSSNCDPKPKTGRASLGRMTDTTRGSPDIDVASRDGGKRSGTEHQ